MRAWDLASTVRDEKKSRDPDWTVGALLGRAANGTTFILDIRRIRGTPSSVQSLVKSTAEEDGQDVAIRMEQEPGSSGVAVIDHYLRHVIPGYDFHGERSTGSKADRALPLAAAAEQGAVKLLRGPWNKDFLDEIETVFSGPHDDQADACSLAYAKLTKCSGEPFTLSADPKCLTVMSKVPRGIFLSDDGDRDSILVRSLLHPFGDD